MSQTGLLNVLGVVLVWAVIWFSMWLDDTPQCPFARTVRIGSMVVAGCR
ncbi:hypothetical protein [Bradyrhizobium sp.]|jgi:hypothetical protein